MFRLHDAVTRAMFILGAIALLGIVGSYLVEVVMRYVFNAPTLWSVSAVAYLLAVSAMLGMPELARTSGHIAITMLEDRMTPARRHSHRRQVAALTAAICVAAAWMVWTETVRQGQSGTTTALAVRIPKVWISAVITYGFTNTALYYLRAALWPASLPWDTAPRQEV